MIWFIKPNLFWNIYIRPYIFLSTLLTLKRSERHILTDPYVSVQAPPTSRLQFPRIRSVTSEKERHGTY